MGHGETNKIGTQKERKSIGGTLSKIIENHCSTKFFGIKQQLSPSNNKSFDFHSSQIIPE